MNHALYVYYNFFSEDYLINLHEQIDNLTIFIWVMCSFCLVLMVVMLFLSWSLVNRIYKNSSGNLGLISMEKLLMMIKQYF